MRKLSLTYKIWILRDKTLNKNVANTQTTVEQHGDKQNFYKKKHLSEQEKLSAETVSVDKT